MCTSQKHYSLSTLPLPVLKHYFYSCQFQLFHSGCFMPVGLAFSGMPSQKCAWVRQTGLAHEPVLPALTLIRKIVCAHARISIVFGSELYELWWTLPCNKFNLTAGTGCNATTTQTPFPPIRDEPCIKGHYITPLFSPSLTHWDCVRWSVRGLEVKLLYSFFSLLNVSVSASPLLTKHLSVQFIPVIGILQVHRF